MAHFGEGLLLITGSNGFLGSEIARQAAARNMRVRVTDRQSESDSSDLPYHPADILDLSALRPAFKGVAQVIHAAGLAHVFRRTRTSELDFQSINEQGTANVCRIAAEMGVRQFILISSVSVYGPSTQGACSEKEECHPVGPYAISKYQAEQRAIECARQSGMDLTILRLATLFGEGDRGNVARLMRSIDKRRFIWIGDGSNLKSLLYRGDAARACLIAAIKSVPGINIYNVSARASPMYEVVNGLANELGRHPPRLRIPVPAARRSVNLLSSLSRNHLHMNQISSSLEKWLANDVYDSERFQQTFAFQIETELNEGLRREVLWYRGMTGGRPK